MTKRIAIVDGIRTPFARAGSVFSGIPAQELGRIALRELIERTEIDTSKINHVIIGNVANPPEAANVARVITLMAGLPKETPAFTVSRNCASGMESITSGSRMILTGEAEVVVAGGAESMSRIPLFFSESATQIFADIFKSKTPLQKIQHLLRFRPKHFAPEIGVMLGLTDPVCGCNMGETAEVLAREFGISREEQDAFAMESHKRAAEATEAGRFKEEIIPIPIPPKYAKVQQDDNGIRRDSSMEKLAKLRPVFDKKYGSVTAGNSSQVTDGAAMILLMPEEKSKADGYTPLGYLKSWHVAGVEPERMGIAPSVAIPELLKKNGMSIKDVGLFEINEAFAAQVLAVLRVLKDLDPMKLNVNGGAVALGHPVGVSGTRLVLTLLKEMGRRNLELGVAALCVGGGQGQALLLERA